MLEQLFKAKCDQDGKMNMCQFLLLCMEKSLVSNRFGLKVFREIFQQASDHKASSLPANLFVGVHNVFSIRLDYSADIFNVV